MSSPLYARELAKLQEEILPHLIGEGAELKITVEIEARNPRGFNESKTRIVEENARTLKFVQAQSTPTTPDRGCYEAGCAPVSRS